MAEPAIIRAAYLNLFLETFRDIGCPVGTRLAQSKIPTWVEDYPDSFVALSATLDLIASCSRDIGLMNLGYIASKTCSLATLDLDVKRAIVLAPTGFARLQRFNQLVIKEDNISHVELLKEDRRVRIVNDIFGFDRHPFLCVAEWMNLQLCISIVRSAVGKNWCPQEITFISQHTPPDAALEEFSATRFLLGQQHSSIVVESDLLSQALEVDEASCSEGQSPAITRESEADQAWTLVKVLKAVMQPYFIEGSPDIELAAEIAGMSKRTLQRRLRQYGRTFSDILEEARFEHSRNLLGEGSLKIVDVALMSGYQNSQHFSRAFARMSGLTPTNYRRLNLGRLP